MFAVFFQAESVLYDLDEAQRLSESRLAEVSQLSQQITELRKELETTRHSSLQVKLLMGRERERERRLLGHVFHYIMLL